MSVQLIDVPSEVRPGRSWLSNNRLPPTQARPKQTLFGTTLQRRDKPLLEDIRAINIKSREEQNTKASRRSPGVEEVLKSDAKLLSKNKELFSEYQKQTSKAEKSLSSIEKQSRYFKAQSNADNSRHPVQERTKESQKLTDKDLEHAAEINTVGLKNGSYNHHKYGNRPPVHQYSLVGDPFTRGMDFTDVADKPNHMIPQMQRFKRHRDPFQVPKEVYMQRATTAKTICVDDEAIPANIQHLFGTKVCEMLLADPEKVKRTITEQKRAYELARKPHHPLHRIEMPPEGLDPVYKEIGTSTRSNIFGPSITCNHKVGTMKQNFNDDVHRRRVAETDEFRYQRDELSQWWQHETLRGAMQKNWDEYLQSRPKFTVNWDRDAKRPPPPPKPKEPKPKPKPKPRKAPSPLNDVVFEDIEFKTPPLTPQAPPPPPPAPAPKLSDNNDDFWDFYNQEVPLP